MTLPEGTITFLRSDIEGSMELVRALGARYDESNAEHQAIARSAVAEHGGQVVRTEGDAFFVVFTDAGAAARAAVAIQRAMGEHAWPEGHEFKLRIGIHTGIATRAGDDYGGFEVNRAARIAAAGWGGQIVLSDPARALIATEMSTNLQVRDLGLHRLKGIAEPERLFQLDAPGLGREFAPLRAASGATDHLPARLTTFIGREEELAALDDLLPRSRLLTLTGPGGTGKTTLALELARRHAGEYADGAWFVDLQALRDPSLVKAEIAHGLGMYDGAAGPAADRLIAFISSQELLIVVDNFEQVLDAANVVGEMLQASAGTCIIVTSRGPLRLGMEQEYAVRPMSLDADAPAAEPEAVRLFIDRVRRVWPGASFDGEDMEAVRETCRLLDGLPLAIELTAARAGGLPMRLIRDRLAKRLPLPGSGPRDLPDRQKTIDHTVAWSYELLDAPLQRLFARLAVFAGTFDLEQAEVVAGPTDEFGVDALEGIFQLTEQSLLMRVDDAVGGVRFGMLETIRSHALARLADLGEEATVQERHASAYASLAETAAAHIPGSEQGLWIDRLEPDAANLRAAALWTIDTKRAELALRCAAVPWRFWLMTGRLVEGRQLIRAAMALAGAEAHTPLRLRTLDALGGMEYWSGDLQRASALYEEQLALAHELADDQGRAQALLNVSYSRAFVGDSREAESARAEAIRLFDQQGDQASVLRIEVSAAFAALRAASDAGTAQAEAIAGRLEATGDRWFIAWAQSFHGWIALNRGDAAAAGEAIVSGLRSSLAMHDFASASFFMEPLVRVLAIQGDQRAAATTQGAMKKMWARYGVQPPISWWELAHQPDPLPSVREALGSDRFEAAIERGGRMSVDESLDYVVAAIVGIAAREAASPSAQHSQP